MAGLQGWAQRRVGWKRGDDDGGGDDDDGDDDNARRANDDEVGMTMSDGGRGGMHPMHMQLIT